jgi:ribosomal protein S8E
VFCKEKKSKCPKKKKENFQSVKRGKMFKYRISGVRKKNERKIRRARFLGGNFALQKKKNQF